MSNPTIFSDELIRWIFSGMRRDDDQQIYYNRLKGDVQQLTNGYLSSLMTSDQSAENKKLLNRIQSGDDHDEIIAGVHYLLPQIKASDYLGIFNSIAKNNEFFVRLVNELYTDLVRNRNHIIYINDYLYLEFIETLEKSCNGEESKLKDLNSYIKQTQRFFGNYFLRELAQ